LYEQVSDTPNKLFPGRDRTDRREFICYKYTVFIKKHPLLFSYITLRKSNQFEYKILDKIANEIIEMLILTAQK